MTPTTPVPDFVVRTLPHLLTAYDKAASDPDLERDTTYGTTHPWAQLLTPSQFHDLQRTITYLRTHYLPAPHK